MAFSRSFNADDTSWAQFAPIELHPFFVRCDFRRVEDEEGVEHVICVEGPRLVENTNYLVEISPQHRETLRHNEQRYLRLAWHYVDVRADTARAEREAMIATENHQWGDGITPESLVDLANEYLSRKSERGIIWSLARDRGVDRRTIRRWLEDAESTGVLPAGTLARRPRGSTAGKVGRGA